MKILSCCLLAAAVAAPAAALDAKPDPGLSLSPTSFNDLRVMLGLAAPATSASAPRSTVEADFKAAPHIGVQFVHGRADEGTGWAIGLEYAYDDDLGNITHSKGTNTAFGVGGGQLALRSHTIGLEPMLVLRPALGDPYDWPAGCIQLEFGPYIAGGYATVHIGSSGTSDWTTVLRYGARMQLMMTSDNGWQGGLQLGWESFSADATWGTTSGSISGEGFVGGLVLGRRL